MQKEKISRHQFLRQMGLGGSALVAVYCAGSLSSCSNDTITPSSTTPEIITIDLSAKNNEALLNNGGYIVTQDVVIARTDTGNYVAVTLICSHEGNKAITYQTSEFLCTVHGARYDNSGKGLNVNGTKGLKVYPTMVSGNILTITLQ
jgi:cytochrome b6-f complex iron-sulfur subunit